MEQACSLMVMLLLFVVPLSLERMMCGQCSKIELHCSDQAYGKVCVSCAPDR